MLLTTITRDFSASIVIFAVFLLSVTLWYYKFFLKPFANFPSERLEFRIPYWVLCRQRLDTFLLKKFAEKCKKYRAEGIFVAWFFKPTVLVYGEDLVKAIVQEPNATYKPDIVKLFRFLVRKSLFVIDGEQWKRQKKMITPAFYPKALRSYTSVMNNNAKAMVENLSEKKGETIDDIIHVLCKFNLKSFYETSLGVREGNSNEEEKFVENIQQVVEFIIGRFYKPWLYTDFSLRIFPHARRILKIVEENRISIIKILEQLKESTLARNQSPVNEEESDSLIPKPKPIGEILIEDRLKLPSFSMEELADEINFLIFAGFDTTAHALMWAFFAIGLYPEIQDRVYEEIAPLTQDEIQYSDVQDLIYLDSVIKESLRIYAAPFVGRRVNQDVKCGKYVIPKNTDVVVSPFILHRNPDIYPDPEKFIPERFMDKNSKIRPWHHLPFIEGARPCMGKNYAMLSMKIFIIHVLRNFKVVTLDRAEDITFKWAFLLSAERDPRMKFIPRHVETT